MNPCEMSPMRFLPGVLLLALFAVERIAFTDAPTSVPERADAKEREQLRGEWTLVRETTANGVVHTYGAAGESIIGHWTLTFDGEKFVTEEDYTDPSYIIAGTFALDTNQRPKRIDLAVVEVDSLADRELKGLSRLGVYELDGDHLKLCLARYGVAQRPAGFGYGKNYSTYEFHRMKK